MARHCTIIDFGNCSYKRKRWKATVFETHRFAHESEACDSANLRSGVFDTAGLLLVLTVSGFFQYSSES